MYYIFIYLYRLLHRKKYQYYNSKWDSGLTSSYFMRYGLEIIYKL